MGEQKRLFVAVRPPVEVLDALELVPRPEEPGVRYTNRSQWHVTLRFLGSCDQSEAEAALDSLVWPTDPVVARCGPAVSRLGRSSVIVVPVQGLDALAAAVFSATAGIGESDDRDFTGHLTIARLKRRGACRVAGAPFSAEFPVREIALVASELAPDGARYTTIAEFVAPEAPADHPHPPSP